MSFPYKDKIQVVILAGSKDFGRCPIASRLPLSLWPILGRPAIERVLKNLRYQGIREVSVCSEGGIGSFKPLMANMPDIQLKIFEEPFRAGTAGCIRHASSGAKESLIVVISANVVCSPDIESLVCSHIEQKADLTAVFNPGRGKSMSATSAGIYVCSRAVLEYIPDTGYADIKEWFVPELLRRGRVVKALELGRDVGNFRDGRGYLRAISNYLETRPSLDEELSSLRRKDEMCLWVDKNADIDPSARLLGPVAVMEGAQVAKDTVVFGPSVIGRNCRLGRGSVVLSSVLWDGAQTGTNCEVRNCLLDYNVNVANNTIIMDRVVPLEKNPVLIRSELAALKSVRDKVCDLLESLQGGRGQYDGVSTPAGLRGMPAVVWLAGFAILAAFLWSHWLDIVDLWNVWCRSDEYSSGLLVPFLAGYILWSRREQLKAVPVKPTLWGLLALLFAEGLRLFGLLFMYGSAERFSVVASIAALVLLFLGWRFFKKTATVLLFLCLMLPWPNSVQTAVASPLQQWATSSAAFCLETMGYDAVKEGNVIHIGQTSVAVAEACNGLRMITAFFVISGLVVLLVKREWWEKLIVLASSLPIAILCNTTRLTITAISLTALRGEYWEKIFHDFGGYAMMPVALAAVVAELWLLRWLTVLPDKRKLIIITRQ